MNFAWKLADAADKLNEENIAKCRHGKTQPHSYGLDEEPDYEGGTVLDICLFCEGPK